MGTPPLDYCREVEAYLCRKNDGHLVRVVGPSFELVSAWAARGVPLKIAFAGIDRTFERDHRKGPRRRPLKIDFCDADVLDVFDEWRRAVGLAGAQESDGGADAAAGEAGRRRGPSVPGHLARVVTRLSDARASGAIGEAFDDLIDRVSAELDAARSARGGIRGEARAALVARLAGFDEELIALARATLDAPALEGIERDASAELSAYRDRMTPDAYALGRRAAEARLVRERLNLPTVTF